MRLSGAVLRRCANATRPVVRYSYGAVLSTKNLMRVTQDDAYGPITLTILP